MVNIVLLLMSLSAIILALYVVKYPRNTLPVFIVSVGLADFAKRLMWLPVNARPTFTEYQGALLLPDLILLAGTARVLYDYGITRKLKYRFHWMDVPAALFFLWSLISVLNPAKSLYAGLVGFKSSQMYVLVYFLFRLYDGPFSDLLSRMKYPFIGVALFAACYGFYQSEFGFREFEVRWLASGHSALGYINLEAADDVRKYGPTIAMQGIVRIFSTFASHEQFGFFMGVVAVLLYIYTENRWFRYFTLALLCFALMRTLSRSAWGFTFVATCVLLSASLLLKQKRRIIYPLTLLILMVSGYFFWSYYASRDRAPLDSPLDSQSAPLSSPRSGSLQKQVQLPPKRSAYASRAFVFGTYEWRKLTFRSVIADPSWRKLFGNGAGSMFYAWRLNEPGTTPPSLEEVHKNGIPVPGKRVISHIGTVDMIYELGILGFLIFVWLIVAASWYAIRFLWQPGPEDEMKVVVIAGLALFLGILAANSTVATLLIFRPIAVAFFMGLGLIAEGSRQLEKPETLSFISTSYTGC